LNFIKTRLSFLLAAIHHLQRKNAAKNVFRNHVHPDLKNNRGFVFFLALFYIFSDQRFSYYKVESISINEYLFLCQLFYDLLAMGTLHVNIIVDHCIVDILIWQKRSKAY